MTDPNTRDPGTMPSTPVEAERVEDPLAEGDTQGDSSPKTEDLHEPAKSSSAPDGSSANPHGDASASPSDDAQVPTELDPSIERDPIRSGSGIKIDAPLEGISAVSQQPAIASDPNDEVRLPAATEGSQLLAVDNEKSIEPKDPWRLLLPYAKPLRSLAQRHPLLLEALRQTLQELNPAVTIPGFPAAGPKHRSRCKCSRSSSSNSHSSSSSSSSSHSSSSSSSTSSSSSSSDSSSVSSGPPEKTANPERASTDPLGKADGDSVAQTASAAVIAAIRAATRPTVKPNDGKKKVEKKGDGPTIKVSIPLEKLRGLKLSEFDPEKPKDLVEPPDVLQLDISAEDQAMGEPPAEEATLHAPATTSDTPPSLPSENKPRTTVSTPVTESWAEARETPDSGFASRPSSAFEPPITPGRPLSNPRPGDWDYVPSIHVRERENQDQGGQPPRPKAPHATGGDPQKRKKTRRGGRKKRAAIEASMQRQGAASSTSTPQRWPEPKRTFPPPPRPTKARWDVVHGGGPLPPPVSTSYPDEGVFPTYFSSLQSHLGKPPEYHDQPAPRRNPRESVTLSTPSTTGGYYPFSADAALTRSTTQRNASATRTRQTTATEASVHSYRPATFQPTAEEFSQASPTRSATGGYRGYAGSTREYSDFLQAEKAPREFEYGSCPYEARGVGYAPRYATSTASQTTADKYRCDNPRDVLWARLEAVPVPEQNPEATAAYGGSYQPTPPPPQYEVREVFRTAECETPHYSLTTPYRESYPEYRGYDREYPPKGRGRAYPRP